MTNFERIQKMSLHEFQKTMAAIYHHPFNKYFDLDRYYNSTDPDIMKCLIILGTCTVLNSSIATSCSNTVFLAQAPILATEDWLYDKRFIIAVITESTMRIDNISQDYITNIQWGKV